MSVTTRCACVLRVYGALWGAIAAGAAAAAAVEPLGRAVRAVLQLSLDGVGPHDLATAAAIALHNTLTAGWPAALAALGLARSGGVAQLVNIIVAGSLAANAAIVGLALGAYGTRLAPFLVHLPLEVLALACGATAWIGERRGRPTVLQRPLATVAGCATVAAVLEVFATPH